MKRLMMIMSILVVATMILAACSTTVEPEDVPESGMEDKMDDTMDDDDMDKDHMDDDMEKDDMTEDKDMMEEDKDMSDEDKMDDDHMDDDKMEEDKMDDSMEKDDMETTEMMNEGDMAPELELMSVDGETVRLSDFKGEKVYVKYWASWCPICLSGLDAIDELSTSEDFKVITIVTPGFKGEKSADDFKEWFAGLETENITVLLDVDGQYAKQFGLIGFPTSIYVGSDGIVTSVAPGHSDNVDIEAKLDSIY